MYTNVHNLDHRRWQVYTFYVREMKATDLRRDLFRVLKRVASRDEQVMVTHRGRALAGLISARDLVRRKNLEKPRVGEDFAKSFCARHGLKSLYLFGSILTDEFNADSDVDVMIEYRDVPSLLALEQMRIELEQHLGRTVDLVTKAGVERSAHAEARESILKSAEVVYSE